MFETGEKVLLLQDNGVLPAIVIDHNPPYWVILGEDNVRYDVRSLRLARIDGATSNDDPEEGGVLV